GGLGFYGGRALRPDCSNFTCRARLTESVFAGLGASLGTALPIYFLGNLFDGQGSLGYTLLGASLGAVPSAVLAFGGPREFENVGSVLFVVTPIVGSFLGYGLSHRSASAKPTLLGARVAPVLSMSRQGVVVGGLVGQF
ncbi:hypothetical protein D7V88_38195, partial [Corallococcus terminator]